MKYTQESWDQPGTNELESNSYDDLDSNGKAGAMSFGLSGEIWDCHINHYSGYYWADLEEGGIDQYYSVLGWNIDNWENDGPVPDTEDAYWDELSPGNKQQPVQFVTPKIYGMATSLPTGKHENV